VTTRPPRRAGLLAEVLASLALVMAAATGVLAVVLVAHHEAAQRELLAAALASEARAPGPVLRQVVPGTQWWTLAPGGAARARDPGAGPPDAESRALAEEARRSGSTLLRTGGSDEPLRFAVPLGAGGAVAVARLPVEASVRIQAAPRRVALGVLVADAAIFTAFGASLMRRRLVVPLRRLRDAAEATAAGASGARVPEEGAREAAELASAFNTMVEALERRTGALEKAVSDLRAANQDVRRARAGLERAERLAAVGRLAAGVAHEVGNPMGAILAFLDLARRDAGLTDGGRAHLERAAREGERVREILRRLLDFSRPARGVPAPLDLAAAAGETVALVRAQRRYERVAFEVERAPDAPQALADPHAVTQILLNLVLNAADAARAGAAPRVRLRVRGAALARRRDDAGAEPSARARWDAVECAVEDNGPGVAPEDRERIFDPFFTTKPPGEGTGLGLANALRQAEESGGTLELAQAGPEGGARFVLRLPAAAAAGEASSDLRADRST
jgi:signal transduction histidine kinase